MNVHPPETCQTWFQFHLPCLSWVEQPCCHEEQSSTSEASQLFLRLTGVLLGQEKLLLAQSSWRSRQGFRCTGASSAALLPAQ